MTYSIVGIIAIVIHLIINVGVFFDVIKNTPKFKGEKIYFQFLIAVIIFHLVDILWGVFYEIHPSQIGLFISMTFYFIFMAISILLWGVFVYKYLGLSKKESKVIFWFNHAVFLFQAVTIVINMFIPGFLFNVTALGAGVIYDEGPIRYANMVIQIVIYLLSSVYILLSAVRAKGADKKRHFFVALFGLLMATSIILAVFFPKIPMYSFGFLFGICILHAFVIRNLLIESQTELKETKQQVLIDALTGVYSKHAYIDVEDEIEKQISVGSMGEFAMVVFDLNDLKLTNDTYGHEAGDAYLIHSTKLIKEYFKDIPIYRIGGDEFCAILIGSNYENREQLFEAFNKRIDINLKNKERLIISSGLATFNPNKDTTMLKVFTRADREMYARKQELKEKQAQ